MRGCARPESPQREKALAAIATARRLTSLAARVNSWVLETHDALYVSPENGLTRQGLGATQHLDKLQIKGHLNYIPKLKVARSIPVARSKFSKRFA